jgi:hypothetical protein
MLGGLAPLSKQIVKGARVVAVELPWPLSNAKVTRVEIQLFDPDIAANVNEYGEEA